MKNRLILWLLAILLIAVLVLPGCARVIHKEFEPTADGKGFMRSETEYDRIGDQKMSGLEASKLTPDGTQLTVKVEQQESEGTLKIEGVISALAEVAAALMDKGLTVEAGQLQTAITELQAAKQ